MKTLEHSSLGYPKSHPNITVAVRKPLTESRSDDVSMCIETVSGKLVNPTCPDASSIDINDIAWSLSRIPRFAGHTITGLSFNVPQHSVYVSELVEEILTDSDVADKAGFDRFSIVEMNGINSVLIKALIHDAHEAYTGDIPSPIKRIPELNTTLKLIEGRLDHAIFTALELSEVTDSEQHLIKYCDKLAQAIEGYQFMPSRGLNWNLPKTDLIRLQSFPQPMAPLDSYKAFIKRFNYLRER